MKEMEDDIDIYEDLPSFEVKQVETVSEATETENVELKKEVAELTDKLEQLRKLNATLEVNLCALLKTAKAEIARKDKTIGELRKELDDALFKRGKYVNRGQGPNRNRAENATSTPRHEQVIGRSYPAEHPSGNFLEQSVNSQIESTYNNKKELVNAESSADEDHVEESRRNIDRASTTVFGERLRKRLAEAEAVEKKERLLKCNSTNNNVNEPVNEGGVAESDKENGNKRVLRENKKQLSTSKDSDTESPNTPSTKRNDFARSENFQFEGKRASEEAHEAGPVKRIKLEKDEDEVSLKEDNRNGLSTRSQRYYEPRHYSHRSSSREKQNSRRFTGERDKHWFLANKNTPSDRREQGDRANCYEKRDYSKRDKSMEKSRFSYDESESDRLLVDRSRNGYWHDHDYIDHYRNHHRDRDYFQDESPSERSGRRTRNNPFPPENRYRKDRFDRNNFNYNETTYNSYSKHEPDVTKNIPKASLKRMPYTRKSNSHAYDRQERESRKEYLSARERKRRESDEYAGRKIKVEKSPYSRRSESLETSNEESKDFNKDLEVNFTAEIEKCERVNVKLDPVKGEPCAVDQSNSYMEEGEIPDTPCSSSVTDDINVQESDVPELTKEPDTDVIEADRTYEASKDLHRLSNIDEQSLTNSKQDDVEPPTTECNEQLNTSTVNEDSPSEHIANLQNNVSEEGSESRKVETLNNCEMQSTISESNCKTTTLDSTTILAELNIKDSTKLSDNACEHPKETTVQSEIFNGTDRTEENHVKEATVKKETVDLVSDKKATTIGVTNDKKSAENIESAKVVRGEDGKKTKAPGDKTEDRVPQSNCLTRPINKSPRTRKPSQNNNALLNVEGKVIVVVRRRNPVRLANSNANMTVLVNSKSANLTSTATNSTTKASRELKSKACRRNVDRSVSHISVPPDS